MDTVGPTRVAPCRRRYERLGGAAASAVAFLASDGAAYVTGHEIVVAGGLTARHSWSGARSDRTR
nr:SDR family oxidoreductase [Kribbella sp. VKM Ac-2569]